MELETVDGGSQRRNLEFDILKTEPQHKMAHLKEVIDRYLPGQEGGAIIYRATRSAAKDTADHLNGVGISSDYFHGGLTPERKKQAQEDFIQGRTRTICATNAFGMGIDKKDIRLVVHADIPGSLENYLQEAGRAGRDQEEAWCVLLYNPEDTERQHSLQAANSLTEDQINAFLKSVKSLDEKNNKNTPDGARRQPVIATTGEILKEDEQGEFDSAGENDDTRGRTAVAWLEETEILDRQENVVSIFPACVTVPDMSEARRRISRRGHNPAYAVKLAQLANRILNADPVQGISTDELSAITGLTFRELRKALTELNAAGVTRDDTVITVYIHQGTNSPSARRFNQADAMESTLIALMAESAPDQQQGETYPLHIRQATQDLKDREHPTALPLHTERIIRSLARTGRETPANTPNIRARAAGDETLRITLLTSWRDLEQGAAQRRLAAKGILKHLRGKLQPGERGNDLLVATTAGELTEAMRLEGALSPSTEASSLLQQALLWLHELEVVRLNQGMTILRPAMTIEVKDRTRKFETRDYEPLQIHYDEQTFQVHIMAEYAEKGLDSVANALRLALDYFTMSKEQFNARWMADRRKQAQLARRTTPESYRRIVESLNNRNQREAVTDNRKTRDILLLAGPGSGKTRTLVHRIAYLVRVRREDPKSIIALAYNRHAAVQIKQRLEELIGTEARAVTIMTCHALAMRLTGRTYQSHAARTSAQTNRIFNDILNEASSYLEGQGAAEGEDNDLREKMLRGFRWILVDEYQDINEETYRLISALAGRSRKEQDEKLRLFAVGDDDQNIYAYDGSSNEYINRFQKDYPADVRYLTENYRSTRHIIDAANAVIAPASDRMKKDRDITIDRVRTMEPPGGPWGQTGPRRKRKSPGSERGAQQRPAGPDSLSGVAQTGQPGPGLALGSDRGDSPQLGDPGTPPRHSGGQGH